MTTPKDDVVEFVELLAATFWRGVRNILWAVLVFGGLWVLVWAYAAMCFRWPTVGWIVSGILVTLWIGTVWND